MDYVELGRKIERGAYDTKFPYPTAADGLLAALAKERRAAWKTDEDRLRGVFERDLRAYFESAVGQRVTDAQWAAVYRKAWDDGHSAGYYEVLIDTADLVDLVKTFMSAKG